MGSIFKDYQDSERNCEPQLLPCLSQGEKSEFEFTFLYFKVYYQKSTPLAILLTIEFLINIRSQNLTYSLYLSLMTLRTSLTSAVSNVKSCHILPPLEHHLSESQNGISLLTLRTVPKLLLTGMLNPICSQNLTYGLYLSLMTLRTSLTSVASNVKLCQELPLWSILLWDLEEV